MIISHIISYSIDIIINIIEIPYSITMIIIILIVRVYIYIYIYIIWVFCWGVSSIDLGLAVYTSSPILMGSWYPSSSGLIPQNIIGLPSGKFTVCYFQMVIEVDLPINSMVFFLYLPMEMSIFTTFSHGIFHGWETHRRWGKSPETREKIPGRLARASDLHWCSVGGFRCP